jgi:hypothetical protein
VREGCRGWHCRWLAGEFGDHWYPAKSKMVLSGENENDCGPARLMVLVDDGYSGRWREEPWHSDLLLASLTVTVMVIVHGRKWVVTRGRVIEPGKWVFGQAASGWRVVECENADEMQRMFDAGVAIELRGGELRPVA